MRTRKLLGELRRFNGTDQAQDGGARVARQVLVLRVPRRQIHDAVSIALGVPCRAGFFLPCFVFRVRRDDLNEHNKLFHNSLILHCSLCSIEIKYADEVRKHYEDHIIHSVPCHYCDKFFLNKRDCSEHVERKHRGKRKRIKNTRSLTILERIDKYSDCDESGDEIPLRKEFVIKVLLQNKSGENFLIHVVSQNVAISPKFRSVPIRFRIYAHDIIIIISVTIHPRRGQTSLSDLYIIIGRSIPYCNYTSSHILFHSFLLLFFLIIFFGPSYIALFRGPIGIRYIPHHLISPSLLFLFSYGICYSLFFLDWR